MARVSSAPWFFFAQKFQAGMLIPFLEICGIAYRMIPLWNRLANPNHKPLMNVDILSSGGASSFAHAHGHRCGCCGLAEMTMRGEYGPGDFSSMGFFPHRRFKPERSYHFWKFVVLRTVWFLF